MSHKRQLQDGGSQHAGDKRSRRRRQKHLYLVLDDWDKGFSIHTIDTDSFFDSDDDDQQPVLRLESPVGHGAYTDMSFSALGTKIFVFMNQRCGLVYDTETAVTAVGAHAPAHMVCGSAISVAVGDVLYVLAYRFFDENGQHSFEAMSWAPTAPDARQHPTEGWSWETLPAPPPSFTTRQRVISYALHPDGSTIFMTTAYRDTPGAPLGTYSFSTKDSVWRWHGEWALPFLGRAYFDGELGAWVGLHRDGYISSSQVVSPDFHSTRSSLKRQSHYMYVDPSIYLDCQMTKEKLFRDDRTRYMGASLIHMGGGSKFCLVECAASKKRPTFGDHGGCVLHATIFGLKCNQRGELQTTNQQSTRSFIVSRHRGHFSPVAFWM